MAENTDTAFVNLKRKIIAVDKLKKHIAKTDAKIADLTKQLSEKDKLIEEKGVEVAKLKAELLESLVNAGDGSVSSDEVEDLKKKKLGADQEYRNSMPASSYQQQKLRVCEICSAYLGIHDNDRRLADHFGGKLHLGFIKIREKLAELVVST